MGSQKKGQIYVITAIIICIAFFMVIATYRARESVPETDLDSRSIERELPFFLDTLSGSFTQEAFQQFETNLSTYYRQRGKVSSIVIFVFQDDVITLYNGFPQPSVLTCGSDQTEIGPDSMHQFPLLTFFEVQSNGTALLSLTRECDLTIFSEEQRMRDIVYGFEFNRTSSPWYKGLVWLEDEDGVQVERFSS